MIEKVTDRDIENWRAYYTPLVSTDNMRGFDFFLLNCMDTIDALRAELARVTAERDALIEQIARLGNDPHSR